jgi:hypothetical protein
MMPLLPGEVEAGAAGLVFYATTVPRGMTVADMVLRGDLVL